MQADLAHFSSAFHSKYSLPVQDLQRQISTLGTSQHAFVQETQLKLQASKEKLAVIEPEAREASMVRSFSLYGARNAKLCSNKCCPFLVQEVD